MLCLLASDFGLVGESKNYYATLTPSEAVPTILSDLAGLYTRQGLAMDRDEILEGAFEGALEGAVGGALDVTLGPLGLLTRAVRWVTSDVTDEPQRVRRTVARRPRFDYSKF